MTLALLFICCACSDGATDVSSADSVTSIPEVSVDISDIITSLTSEQRVSSEEIDKSEQISSDSSSEPPVRREEKLTNVSTEKAGQDAGISLDEALNLYRATVNDGRLCVWKKTENKEKHGVDVELLMYDEEDDRLEYVITYTVENRRFTPFSIKNDGFWYQYGDVTDSTRDVFFDNSFDDIVDLAGDTPKVYLNGTDAPYYPNVREEEYLIFVEYGEGLSINDGVYEIYSFHPEYGELGCVDARGNYAVMIFETDEHFTESTSTILIYDYANKTETVIDAVEGEHCGATTHEYVDAWFSDEEHLVVYTDDDGDTYIYETKTGKKTVIEGVGGSEYFGDGVTRMNIEHHNGYILWHERNEGLFSMSLEDYSVISLAEEVYFFEIVNDKLLVKTGGLDYTVDAGELYVSDGATLTLIDTHVYCYFFVNDTLWYQVGDGDGNYEWFSKPW